MKVFVTGGTGFVGHEVVRQLVAAGHTVRCLVRPGSENRVEIGEKIEVHHGDALDPESLEGALIGCRAVLHLVGIIREFPARGITFDRLHAEATANVVDAARSQNVGRYLQMSANGTREGARCDYHRTKWQAEEIVRASGLEWTIFRPSLIFGPGDQFVNMLAGQVCSLPVAPVLGDGRYRMSPVAVGDVAKSFVLALKKPETAGQTYHCCGPQALSYNEILDEVGRALGRKKVVKLHHPLLLMKPLIALLEGFPAFPVTRSQVTMLLEGNVCDPAPWAEAFALRPLPFSDGIRRYLKP